MHCFNAVDIRRREKNQSVWGLYSQSFSLILTTVFCLSINWDFKYLSMLHILKIHVLQFKGENKDIYIFCSAKHNINGLA